MKKTKELAFLNFLKHTSSNTINFQNEHVIFSFKDLEEKMELDKKNISIFLSQLKNDSFLDITELSKDDFSVHFHMNFKRLFDFINPHDFEDIIEEIYHFISKYSVDLNLNFSSDFIIETAKKAYPLIEKNPNYDISPIIREGVQKVLLHTQVELYLAKILFSLSDKIDDEDQEVYENIIYYFLTLPYEDNPFLTTFFFSKVVIQLEAIKKGVKWDNVLDLNSDNDFSKLNEILNEILNK